jgi:HEPN domain-containing protein
MKRLPRNWLAFAPKDLQAANQLGSNAELTALTAFHCQQCIEKSFKAILASYDEPPPRIIELITLHTQVEELI